MTSLQDYFGDDHIFIAYGPEKHHLDDFNLDVEGEFLLLLFILRVYQIEVNQSRNRFLRV